MPEIPDSERQPWRCDSCGELMYNLDDGKPAPGAPSSYFGGESGGKRYEQVCTLCYEMRAVLSTDYWRDIQRKEDAIRAARLQKFKEQGGGVI